MDEQTSKNKKNPSESNGAIRGVLKGNTLAQKNNTLKLNIHETSFTQPETIILPGSTFKGYRDFVVQELEIHPHNTRYRLARWQTPTGETLLCAGDQNYRLNQVAIDYLKQQKLPQAPLNRLLNSPQGYWPDAKTWEAYLNAQGIDCEPH